MTQRYIEGDSEARLKIVDLDEDKILNDPREAAIQAKMMAEIAAIMAQPPAGAEQPQNGAPSVQDPTGSVV